MSKTKELFDKAEKAKIFAALDSLLRGNDEEWVKMYNNTSDVDIQEFSTLSYEYLQTKKMNSKKFKKIAERYMLATWTKGDDN